MPNNAEKSPGHSLKIIAALPPPAGRDLASILDFLRASQDDPDRAHTTRYFTALPAWLRARLNVADVLRQDLAIDAAQTVSGTVMVLGLLTVGILMIARFLPPSMIIPFMLAGLLAGAFTARKLAARAFVLLDACLPARRVRYLAIRRRAWLGAVRKATTCSESEHAREMASMEWETTRTLEETVTHAYATMKLDIGLRQNVARCDPTMLACLDAVVRRHAVSMWRASKDSTCGYATEWLPEPSALPLLAQPTGTPLGQALAAMMKKERGSATLHTSGNLG